MSILLNGLFGGKNPQKIKTFHFSIFRVKCFDFYSLPNDFVSKFPLILFF